MARIELRDCTIRMKDGTAGTANIATATPGANDVSVNIANAVLNTNDPDLVPVGARFTVSTVNHTLVHTVVSRTPANTSPTVTIGFSPKWQGLDANAPQPVPVVNDVITFGSQQINIKIGEGNLTYTEHKDFKYMLDRGNLDAVRDADEKPVDVKTDFVYDFVTSGTDEDITPVDALKRQNKAAEWVSASADLCEPYAVDVEIIHVPPCTGEQAEITILPTFRYETLEFNLKDATISVTGKCNVEQAIVTRVLQSAVNNVL
jgi:hypothetical protein